MKHFMFFCYTLNKLTSTSVLLFTLMISFPMCLCASYVYIVAIGIKLDHNLFPAFDDCSLTLGLDFLEDHPILA